MDAENHRYTLDRAADLFSRLVVDSLLGGNVVSGRCDIFLEAHEDGKRIGDVRERSRKE